MHPAQILSEEPSLEALAEQHRAVYVRVDGEIPGEELSQDERMLLSVVDGKRDVNVIWSISGIEVDEVLRLLEGLERRSLLVRRS